MNIMKLTFIKYLQILVCKHDKIQNKKILMRFHWKKFTGKKAMNTIWKEINGEFLFLLR